MERIGDVQRISKLKNGLKLNCGNATVMLTVVGEGIVRVRAFRDSKPPKDRSWAVVMPKDTSADFKVEKTEENIRLVTRRMKVEIDKKPFSLSFYDGKGRLLNSDAARGAVAWDRQRVACRKKMPKGEHYYGFGEKAFHLDRRGKKMVNWNTDAAPTWNSDPLYQTIPFFIAMNDGVAHGIFFDSTWKSFFDMGASSSRTYRFGAEGGEMNYYFLLGPKPADVLARHTRLTGRTPMPPRWALGYHQSRWGYRNEKIVKRIAGGMREHEIPCDVIHIDIHYMDGYRVFTWHPRRFPEPERMIKELREMGIRVVVINDPGVKREEGYRVYDEVMKKEMYLKKTDGKPFHGFVWPGKTVFPDFSRGDVRRWWGDQHREFIRQGVCGIWNDMNEPSHNIQAFIRRVSTRNVVHHDNGQNTPHLKNRNVYGLQEGRATREGLLRLRPGERPFVLTRAGYSGIQRYAAVWTGDNSSTWRHLHLSLPMLMGMGLSGVSFVGCDIGGFTLSCSRELYARWIQVGAFYPFCRTHAAIMTRDQEPWAFGKRVTDIAREYITLRYQLLPYIYTLFRESAETGAPVFRPLFYEFPGDPECATIEDEAMVGSAFLVAPVIRKGERKREVYLPAGEWFDFWTGERLSGGRTIAAKAPLERMPVYVRGGAIIPMQGAARCTDEMKMDPLILKVYPSGKSTFTLYEDDGLSNDYEKGVFCETHYDCDAEGNEVEFKISARKGRFDPGNRTCRVEFHGIQRKPNKVTLNGRAAKKTGMSYDAERQTLIVTFRDNGKQKSIRIR